MATKKPKAATKTTTSKTAKPKTAAKTATKPVSEAPKTNPVKEETVKTKTEQKSCLKGFFAKKYEEKESILTIFKNHKFYGALVGEIIGTAFITLMLLSMSILGLVDISRFGAFAIVGIYVAIYAFSGACLNPIVTVGMMASRRMSVIRGVMYIIAEILGAWVGWIIFNAFHLAGGETAYDVPTMAAVADGKFWVTAMIELLGGVIIAFFFARALKYKRSVFTFGAVVAGGMLLAILIGFIASQVFNSIQNCYVMNPAAALMFQIFPTTGENFGEIIGGVGQALAIYALFPAIGGVCGFYLSDFASKLSGEE
ncbi:aquaporin [Candidatus Saccharibacteria bacterium]|nr:aquaporin [Candidatus Saccharibacteria bacterium]